MTDFIQKISDCLLPHLLIISIVAGLFLFVLKSKYRFQITVIILFCIIWRSLIGVESSRYFSILLIPSICLCYFVIKHISPWSKSLFFLLTSSIIVAQTFKVYSGDKNNYILDLCERLDAFQKKDPSIYYLVDEKEYRRLFRDHDSNNHLIMIDDKHTPDKQLRELIDSYYFWGTPLVFIVKDKEEKLKSKFAEKGFQEDVFCYSNKKSKKNVSIYTRDKREFPYEPEKVHSDNNLIANGRFETVMKQPAVRKRFKKWIDNGLTFYDEETTVIPEHSMILSTWQLFPEDDYPVIYADSMNPIEGKYSLYSRFTRNNNSLLYLNLKIPSTPGVLSFTIRIEKEREPIVLIKTDYDENGQPYVNQNKILSYLWFEDNEPHDISIKLDQNDCMGKTSLFYLRGKDASVSLDNLSYVANE